ncbi:MAG: ferritin family protein [Candidatus Nitronauta litoralis]|uniref:Ferritin family protein n=1 Tax=Candidatus Nitronauta litoralis TaxID=2705533 RepID=A0A7T0BXC5_9BACT|nr:MAG: ferritin family protein [Candidatus Nitronauta litoralis]
MLGPVCEQITDKEILDISLKIEREGQYFYEKLAELVPIPEIKDFLSHMAQEETRHERQFINLIAEKKGKDYGWDDNEELREAVEKLFQTDIFPDIDEWEREENPFPSVNEAIEFAIEAEMISMEFYRLLGEFCNNLEAKTVLAMLEKAEMEHLHYMKALHAKYSTP